VRVAAEVPAFALAEYQKTVRTLLRHPLVTATHPDTKTLQLVRRWADPLRKDLAEQLGYRLEFVGHAARLVRPRDALDATHPAQVKDRTFDRQRYAYLALALAVLGRAGIQITLGELAEAVAADAARVEGLGLDTDKLSDRRAFVDAVTWLEERGALNVADGSISSWASDPDSGEALYDIGRDVVNALFRPARVLQHVTGAAALLQHHLGTSENAQRQAAAQKARRLLLEQPVVYFHEVDRAARNHLRSPAVVEDIERLTGLRVERRGEGLMLVDTAGFSDARFPGTGAVAQAALLLLGEMADRFVDPDARKLLRHAPPPPAQRHDELLSQVDSALPRAGVLAEAAASLAEPDAEPDVEPDVAGSTDAAEPADEAEEIRFPFVADSFLRTKMKDLMTRYGVAFGETWRADPERLRLKAIELLDRYRIVHRVDGGVLLLPLAGRYRNVTAKISRRKPAAATLFDLGEAS
jgi:uncharacterized protein (TIGR02678 family)